MPKPRKMLYRPIFIFVLALLATSFAHAVELTASTPAPAPAAAPSTQPTDGLLTKTPGQVSFKLDVMPIFMRSGCNTGSCHGAARGKDGFHLSLFGYDPDGDYFRMTREIPNRRINLAIPEDSLMLTKSTGAVQHTGGERFSTSSPYYATLKRWIEAGANLDGEDVATVTGLDIEPKQIVLEGEGVTQQFKATATYSDGIDRDVTNLALFLTNNDNSAAITPDGLVTAKNRGEAFVMARFATFTVGSQVIVIPKDLKYDWPDVPENNYIDTLVHAKLQKLRILPSELCDDETFLRRVFIDVIGKAPHAGGARRISRRRFIRQAREARRRAARAQGVRRAVGDEVGRAAADPHRPESGQLQGCVSLLQLAAGPAVEERADGPGGPRAARRRRAARSRTPRRTTTRSRPTSSSSPRTPPRCSWACASSVPSATTIRSTAGRWTTTTASSRSSPRSAASPAKTRARRSCSTRAAGKRHTPSPISPSPRSSSAVKSPTSKARTAGRCSPTGWRRPTTPTSPATSPTSSGPTSRQGHHRSGRRRPRQQPRQQPRIARRAVAEAHRVQLRLQEARPRHLHQPNVSALVADQRDERRRQSQLRPRRRAAHPRRESCSTSSRR